jgi:hypothetical protein
MPAATPPTPIVPQLLQGGDDAASVRDRVIAEAAGSAGVAPAEVQVLSFEPREWPDASLGCPRPDQAYAQVISPGYAVVVRVRGVAVEYHADRRQVVRCP